MEEFKIEGYDFTFRVKKMNAIETLALRTQLDFDSVDKAKTVFDTMLEYIEVKCDNSWLEVKTKGANVYFPPQIETDVNLVKALVEYFGEKYLKPVF